MAGAGVNRNNFTAEQVEILSKNPYVRSVNENMVYFTAEFKYEFWHLYSEEGMTAYDILNHMGIDYHILGSSRVQGLTNNIKKQYKRHGGFADKRPEFVPGQELSPKQEIMRLRMEVEYLRQEKEFLKKIISTGKGGNSK